MSSQIRCNSLLAGILNGALVLTSAAGGAEPKAATQFVLESPAIRAGAAIPGRYTCDAEDFSPPLRWENAPKQTKAFALIVDDPDAPGGTWVHWVIYDLPATANELAENISKSATLATGAKQGRNDFGRVGYGGPCPPPGRAHRYHFKLYALDAPTGLKPSASKAQLLEAIKGHVLGQAELIGRYQR
ncbi:MAG: YbhB/YbcL family Raf kinase inhibitor-like protein [Chloroflexota bacterium]